MDCDWCCGYGTLETGSGRHRIVAGEDVEDLDEYPCHCVHLPEPAYETLEEIEWDWWQCGGGTNYAA